MKTKIFLLLYVLLRGANLFAEFEQTLNIGLSYQDVFNVQGETSPFNLHRGMLGFDMTGYMFWNRNNIGFLFNGAAGAPVVSKMNDKENIEFDYYGANMGMVLGVGFRHPLPDKFALLAGIGPGFATDSIQCYFVDGRRHHITKVELGLGGQLAVKYDIKPKINIMVGCNFQYDFVNYTNVIESYNALRSGWSYNAAIRSSYFIGLGFN